MLTRERIIAAITPRLEAQPCIRAAWLGGSDATGRADDRSDVDTVLIVEPGTVEQAARAFEAAVNDLSPIRVRLRLPMPTWHGFHQAFYQLQDAADDNMIDWLMIERGQQHEWFVTERHGTPRVLFDKDGLIHPSPLDRDDLHACLESRVQDLRAKFALFRHLPAKLIDRGLPVDAAYFYSALILRPLVDMLRILHCPERHDFGFRYVQTDLPPELAQTLARLWYIPDPSALKCRIDEATALFQGAVADWDARHPGSGA